MTLYSKILRGAFTVTIIWLLVATFFIALAFSLFPQLRFLLAMKDLVLLAYLLIALPVILIRLKRFPVWLIIPLLVLFIFFLISPAQFNASSASFRQMIMPFVLVFVGLSICVFTEDAALWLRRRYLHWAAGLVIIGAIFYVRPVWHIFSLGGYAAVKHMELRSTGALGMFYDPWLPGVQRLYSTLMDPINLGHLLLSVLIIGSDSWRGSQKWVGLLLLAGFVATLCKGAYLQAGIFTILYMGRNFSWLIRLLLLILLAVLLVVAGRHHPGVLLHLKGLNVALQSSSLWGSGVGMVGNQAIMYGDGERSAIADTFIGAILGQIGWFGLTAWLSPFCWLLYQLRKNKKIQALLASQLLVALISENAFNLLSILFLMLYVAVIFCAERRVQHAE